MKTRNQFVSNSSSSSFVIFGVATSYEELCKALFYGQTIRDTKLINGCEHEFDRTTYKFCGFCGKPAIIEVKGGKFTTPDFITALDKIGLGFRAVADGWGGIDYYVGRTVDNFKYEELVKLDYINHTCVTLFNRPAIITILTTE